MSAACAAVSLYRARKPEETPLYRLVEALYDQVKGVWEERFEHRYGFWRAFIDTDVAERLFRQKVLCFLTSEGLLSEERARILMSWNHNSGFSVDDSVRFEPEDRKSMEKVARYIVRPPLSLERLKYSDGDDEVEYRRKGSDGRSGAVEKIEALDFLARVIAHIPPPRIHLVRYLGRYSNVSRGRRKKGKEEKLTPGHSRDGEDDGFTDAERRARRRAWARLIRRVYEVDPLVCSNCGGEMRIVSVILEHRVITKILGHLAGKGIEPGRGPPEWSRSPLPKTA